MSHIIYKYPLQRGAPNVIPDGDVVLVAAQQPSDTYPTAWVKHRRGAPCSRTIFIAATGEDLPAASVHLGSAVCADGSLVWHVYAVS